MTLRQYLHRCLTSWQKLSVAMTIADASIYMWIICVNAVEEHECFIMFSFKELKKIINQCFCSLKQRSRHAGEAGELQNHLLLTAPPPSHRTTSFSPHHLLLTAAPASPGLQLLCLFAFSLNSNMYRAKQVLRGETVPLSFTFPEALNQNVTAHLMMQLLLQHNVW